MKENHKDIAELLENRLDFIVSNIAKEYGIESYSTNPDFLEKRLYPWHEFGLITHTKKVRSVFLNELDSILKDWDYTNINQVLNKKIDGIKKKDLIEISIPLHDLGKIIVFGSNEKDRGHEKLSVYLINQNPLKEMLYSFGLTDNQIKYISRCVETHDVIGKEIRDELKHAGKLNSVDINNNDSRDLCRLVSNRYSDVKHEIGVYFLCDSLGKTDVITNSQNEEEISKILERKGLREELKSAVMQLPTNMKLAEVYFRFSEY
ncbi:Uncharacterised protein [uncultured archaeon]|nr:Uncharacterised protein [uncultured archaeon]